MIILARLLTRLVGIALLALCALVGIAAAVFCVQGGRGTVSLPGLAADAHLPAVRTQTDLFLAHLTASGPVAVIALVCGAGAIVVGLVLLVGAWLRPRPRRIVVERNETGTLGTMRRPLGRLAARHAAEPTDVSRTRARARARRRRDGGRLRVVARATVGTPARQAREDARTALGALTDDLGVRVRVRAHRASRRDRRRHEAQAPAS